MRTAINKSITIRIFNEDYKINVAWGDHKYLQKVAKREGHNWYKVDTHDQSFLGKTVLTKGVQPLILIPRYPRTPEEIGTLAHEAVHAIALSSSPPLFIHSPSP